MVLLGLAVVAGPAASQCPKLYPKVHCVDKIDANTLRIVFGAFNGGDFDELPVVNVFDPNLFSPPVVFEPGYTAGVTEIVLDPTLIPTLKWFLGCQVLNVDTQIVPDSLVCSTKPGPPGPQGPQGPQGPPGPSNLSTCRTVVQESSTPSATAACLVNERVLTGGGSCTNPNRRSASFLRGSYPPSLGTWRAECTSGRATAHAICCQQ
jgi:hypothetical protein